MPVKERFRARARFRGKSTRKGVRADVPAPVRDRFKAREGDVLVFEEGCDAAVQLAALSKGGYMVVRLERAPEPAEALPEPRKPGPALEPLAEAVGKRLAEALPKRY